MKIFEVQLAHFRQQTATGQFIDFAIFDARTESGSESDNLELLNGLVNKAIELEKLKIDQAALMFKRDGEIRFYGSTDLVNYISKVGFPKWTHTLKLEDPS